MYDKMFYNDALIRKFIDGKYRKCTKGKKTKYNDIFDEKFRKCMKEFRSLTRQLLTCRYIFKKFGTENNINVFYYINNIATITRSLTDNVRLFAVIRTALREYSVESQEIANAFNASVKKSKERVERISNMFLAEYYVLCGLENYMKYLENNGSSIKNDIDIFFMTHNTRFVDFDEMNRAERTEYFDNISKEYYENIKNIMEEKNISYVSTAELLIEEENKRKEHKKKAQEEKRRERESIRIAFIEEEMNRVEGLIFSTFEKGRPVKTKNITISERRIEEISSNVVGTGCNKFYIVMAMALRSKSRSVYFLKKTDEGKVITGTVYSFASCFYSTDQKEAEEVAKQVPAGYYARIARISVESNAKEYVRDEFGNLEEKVYTIQKNHEYFENIANNALVVFKDYVSFIYDNLFSPPHPSVDCNFYKYSLEDLKNIDEDKQKSEYLRLYRWYEHKMNKNCGASRVMKLLVDVGNKFDANEELYHMLIIEHKEAAYTKFRYGAWNEATNSLEMVENIKNASIFKKEQIEKLSQIMENIQQEWYNKPLDTVYFAWTYVKIPNRKTSHNSTVSLEYLKKEASKKRKDLYNGNKVCVSDNG